MAHGERFAHTTARILLGRVERLERENRRLRQALLYLAHRHPGTMEGHESHVVRRIRRILDSLQPDTPWDHTPDFADDDPQIQIFG